MLINACFAGSGIGVSPGGGTGNVTISAGATVMIESARNDYTSTWTSNAFGGAASPTINVGARLISNATDSYGYVRFAGWTITAGSTGNAPDTIRLTTVLPASVRPANTEYFVIMATSAQPINANLGTLCTMKIDNTGAVTIYQSSGSGTAVTGMLANFPSTVGNVYTFPEISIQYIVS